MRIRPKKSENRKAFVILVPINMTLQKFREKKKKIFHFYFHNLCPRDYTQSIKYNDAFAILRRFIAIESVNAIIYISYRSPVGGFICIPDNCKNSKQFPILQLSNDLQQRIFFDRSKLSEQFEKSNAICLTYSKKRIFDTMFTRTK